MSTQGRTPLETAGFLARNCQTANHFSKNCSRIKHAMAMLHAPDIRDMPDAYQHTELYECPLLGSIPAHVVKSNVLLEGCEHNQLDPQDSLAMVAVIGHVELFAIEDEEMAA